MYTVFAAGPCIFFYTGWTRIGLAYLFDDALYARSEYPRTDTEIGGIVHDCTGVEQNIADLLPSVQHA
jgi:hypothetical protein